MSHYSNYSPHPLLPNNSHLNPNPNPTLQPPSSSAQQQQHQQQRATYISCNLCLQPITQQKNLLTPCYHVFCIPCGNQVFGQNPNQCPYCSGKLDATKDIRCITTTDQDLSDMSKRLCTFNVTQLTEMFKYGVKFWIYQQSITEKQLRLDFQRNLIQQCETQLQQQVQNQLTDLQQKYQQAMNTIQQQEQYIKQLKQHRPHTPNGGMMINLQSTQPQQTHPQQQQIQCPPAPFHPRTPGMAWKPTQPASTINNENINVNQPGRTTPISARTLVSHQSGLAGSLPAAMSKPMAVSSSPALLNGIVPQATPVTPSSYFGGRSRGFKPVPAAQYNKFQ